MRENLIWDSFGSNKNRTLVVETMVIVHVNPRYSHFDLTKIGPGSKHFNSFVVWSQGAGVNLFYGFPTTSQLRVVFFILSSINVAKKTFW